MDKVKIAPEDIYNLLTPVALIKGDGSAKEYGLILCSDSYKLIDIVRIMIVLIIRYNLNCRLRYHTPTLPWIFISQRSMLILRE